MTFEGLGPFYACERQKHDGWFRLTQEAQGGVWRIVFKNGERDVMLCGTSYVGLQHEGLTACWADVGNFARMLQMGGSHALGPAGLCDG